MNINTQVYGAEVRATGETRVALITTFFLTLLLVLASIFCGAAGLGGDDVRWVVAGIACGIAAFALHFGIRKLHFKLTGRRVTLMGPS